MNLFLEGFEEEMDKTALKVPSKWLLYATLFGALGVPALVAGIGHTLPAAIVANAVRNRRPQNDEAGMMAHPGQYRADGRPYSYL